MNTTLIKYSFIATLALLFICQLKGNTELIKSNFRLNAIDNITIQQCEYRSGEILVEFYNHNSYSMECLLKLETKSTEFDDNYEASDKNIFIQPGMNQITVETGFIFSGSITISDGENETIPFHFKDGKWTIESSDQLFYYNVIPHSSNELTDIKRLERSVIVAPRLYGEVVIEREILSESRSFQIIDYNYLDVTMRWVTDVELKIYNENEIIFSEQRKISEEEASHKFHIGELDYATKVKFRLKSKFINVPMIVSGIYFGKDLLSDVNYNGCLSTGNPVHYYDPPPNFSPDGEITLKMVVHTPISSSGNRYIPDSSIDIQLNRLNSFYSTYNIQFVYCIAEAYNPDIRDEPIKYLSEKTSDWYTANSLNLYIGPFPTNLPAEDRVNQGANLGEKGFITTSQSNPNHETAIIHEVGHMINLAHTFARGNQTTNVTDECIDPGGYDDNEVIAGDGIADTPPDPRATYINNGKKYDWPLVSSGCHIDDQDISVDYFGNSIETTCGEAFADPNDILPHNPMSYYACDDVQYFTPGQIFSFRCWIYSNSNITASPSFIIATNIDASNIDQEFDPSSPDFTLKGKNLIIDGTITVDYPLFINNCSLFFTEGSGINVLSSGSLYIKGSYLDVDAGSLCSNNNGTWNGITFDGEVLKITDFVERSYISNGDIKINGGNVICKNSNFNNSNITILDADPSTWYNYSGDPNTLTDNCDFINSSITNNAGPHLIYACKFFGESNVNKYSIGGDNLNIFESRIEGSQIGIEAGDNVFIEANEIYAVERAVIAQNNEMNIIRNNKIYANILVADVQFFMVSNNEIISNDYIDPGITSPLNISASGTIANNNVVNANVLSGGAHGVAVYGTGSMGRTNNGLEFLCNSFQNISSKDMAILLSVKEEQGSPQFPASNSWSGAPLKIDYVGFPNQLIYWYKDDSDDPDLSNQVLKSEVNPFVNAPSCNPGTDWENLLEDPLIFGWFWGCGTLYWNDLECIQSGSSDCCIRVARPVEANISSYEEWVENQIYLDCHDVGGGYSDKIRLNKNEANTLHSPYSPIYQDKTESDILLYPNPTHGDLHIQVNPKLLETKLIFKIYSLDGRLVMGKEIYTENQTIKTKSPGIYITKVFKDLELIKTEKIIFID